MIVYPLLATTADPGTTAYPHQETMTDHANIINLPLAIPTMRQNPTSPAHQQWTWLTDPPLLDHLRHRRVAMH